MEKYKEYAGWYCIVKEENREALSKWRFGKSSCNLEIGKCVGICKDTFTKEHNSTTGNYTNNGKYFDKQVSIKRLFEATNLKYNIKEEQFYEIY